MLARVAASRTRNGLMFRLAQQVRNTTTKKKMQTTVKTPHAPSVRQEEANTKNRNTVLSLNCIIRYNSDDRTDDISDDMSPYRRPYIARHIRSANTPEEINITISATQRDQANRLEK